MIVAEQSFQQYLRKFFEQPVMLTKLQPITLRRMDRQERFHLTLSDMISCCINPNHKNWDVIFPLVTFPYNAAIESTTRFSLAATRLCEGLLLLFGPLSTTDNAPDHFVSRLEQCRNLTRLSTESYQNDENLTMSQPTETSPFKLEMKCRFGRLSVRQNCAKSLCLALFDSSKFSSAPQQ